MARILAITNQKGGVGKTTTAINLAASLNRADCQVLLVDMDPQGNATVGSGIDMESIKQGTYEVLLGNIEAGNSVITVECGYDLLPANKHLAGAQVELIHMENRDFKLKSALEEIGKVYDYILIDCPPALNVLTINALTAAESVLIPVQCEYYALEGLSSLIETIHLIKQVHNPSVEILGLVRTMYDGRNSLANEVSEQLVEHFGDQLFRTMIPRNIRLAEAPSYGKPVLDYDRHCAGTHAYLALASEVLRKRIAS